MSRPLLALLLGALAGIAALAPAAAEPVCPAEGQGFRRLKGRDAEVAYRWEPAEPKVGQFFGVEVMACRAPGPVGEVAIDAAMPAHGHGMSYRPSAVRAGPGHYRFTGLMLHMPGTWRITFDLAHGTSHTRLTQDIVVGP